MQCRTIYTVLVMLVSIVRISVPAVLQAQSLATKHGKKAAKHGPLPLTPLQNFIKPRYELRSTLRPKSLPGVLILEQKKMTEDGGAPRIKKSKDKSEKKKRKHVEDPSENHFRSKKSKSVPTPGTTHNEDSRNAIARPEPEAHTNGSLSRKKKKSKASGEANGEDDMSIVSRRGHALSPEPVSEQAPISDPPTGSSKKPKTNGTAIHSLEKINSTSQPNGTTSPSITTSQPQPIIPLSETPYIEQTLRSILSTAISFEENTDKSPFFRQAVQLYLPLSPITLSSAIEGVCAEHLSPLLLKYYAPLHGVVLSYAHPRFSSSNNEDNDTGPLAISVAEYATPMIWLDVDFLLFKPARGHLVEGMIVLQSESHLGLQVYNFFSGRISRTRLPATWKWNHGDQGGKRRAHKGKLKGGRDEVGQKQEQQRVELGTEDVHDVGGYWVDETRSKVKGVLKFWVWEVDIALGGREAERNLPTIEGTLVEEMVLDGEGEGDTSQRRRAIKEGKRKV